MIADEITNFVGLVFNALVSFYDKKCIVSYFGGEGSIIATLIGALMVTTIRNGLNILGVNAFWQYVVNGLVIIAAVAIDQYRRRQ